MSFEASSLAAAVTGLVRTRYESEGRLPAVPALPTVLPAPAEAEVAVAALLAACDDTRS